MEDFFLESLGQKHGCTLHMAKYSDPLDSESPEQKILSNPGESLKKEVPSLVVLWMRHSARVSGCPSQELTGSHTPSVFLFFSLK